MAGVVEDDEILPKCEWQYWLMQGDKIAVGHYIRHGYLGYSAVSLADLPNDLVTADDLKSLGIALSRDEGNRPIFKLNLSYGEPSLAHAIWPDLD